MTSEYTPGLEEGANDEGVLPSDLGEIYQLTNFTPDSNFDDRNIEKSEILDYGDEGFLLYNLMTDKESRSIINEGEDIGFEKIKFANDNYRSSQRILVKSDLLAELLWKRIKDYLGETTVTGNGHKQHVHGIPFQLEGTWTPVGLNNAFRLCRYVPGGHFAPHFDGFFARCSGERSLKTLMLYLNGEFDGGSTNFVDESQVLYKDENGKYCAEDKNILCRIQPKSGMAILFNHHRLHEGQKLKSGKKYILRTDVMYRKMGTSKMSENEEKALVLIQDAERFEASGECMKAAEYYRKAFKLCPELENYH